MVIRKKQTNKLPNKLYCWTWQRCMKEEIDDIEEHLYFDAFSDHLSTYFPKTTDCPDFKKPKKHWEPEHYSCDECDFCVARMARIDERLYGKR